MMKQINCLNCKYFQPLDYDEAQNFQPSIGHCKITGEWQHKESICNLADSLGKLQIKK